MSRPTPETDAEYKEAKDYEPSAFVEPLAKFLAAERERNEAREAIHALKRDREEWELLREAQHDRIVGEFAKVYAERDEARDVLEEISLYLSSGMGDENTTAQQYKERILDGVKHLAGHAWEERCKFEQERDEARELLESEKITRNHIIKRSVEVERERDDLQKAVNGLCKNLGVSPANTTLLAVEVLRIQREREEAITRRMETIMQCELYEQERDEAREALREIWQSGDAFLPYIDNETTNRWRKAAGWEETK